MNIDTNYIPRNAGFQAQSAPRNGYNLAPVHHVQPLPSAPQSYLVYDVVPPVPNQTIHAPSGHNNVVQNVPQARLELAPQPANYTAPHLAPQAQASASSSACQPWVVVVSVVIVSLVIGGAVVAIVVTLNNNNKDSNDCESNEFYCGSGSTYGSCIPASWQCDHFPDCQAGEDESYCPGNHCPNGDHYCDGLCISSYYICDGDSDCYDNSDEYFCSASQSPCNGYTCPAGHLIGSSNCIPLNWLCDGITDCVDAYDEQGCSGTWTPGMVTVTTGACDGYTCPEGYLIGSSNCIPTNWLCDGITDCVGGYDEQGCSGIWTTPSMVTVSSCPLNETLCDGRCIASYSVCDGYPDCSNGEDEANCPINCTSNQFHCSSGSAYGYYGYCIPDYWQCDDYQDCLYGEDEYGCSATHSPSSCSGSQYTCPSGGIYGDCIPIGWVCDGWNDCYGSPDEENCNVTCDSLHEFTCENGGVFGHCINISNQCDGYNHCTDGADEQNCDDTYACPNPSSSYTLRIPIDKVCDQHEDCPGGTDEDRCLIMETGETSIPKAFYAATLEFYPLCGYGWKKEYSDFVCAFVGYNSSRDTRVKFGEYGFIVSETSPYISAPTQCPNDEIVEVSCIRKEVCGGTAKRLRIVGGEDAKIEDHPWQVSIQEGSNYTGWNHFCGGTIVSNRWVFSAAHCLIFIHEDQYEFFRVIAGVERLSAVNDTNYYGFDTVIVHPLYDSYSLSMDFGLIKVSKPFIRSTKIQLACLPAPGQLFNDLAQVLITGWGKIHEGGLTPDVLQDATVNFYNRTTCAATFTSLQHLLHVGMVCAGLEEGGIDTCQGDSGGPLVADISGVKYLLGATSWGFGCARPNSPGVYADVVYVRDWVNRETYED